LNILELCDFLGQKNAFFGFLCYVMFAAQTNLHQSGRRKQHAQSGDLFEQKLPDIFKRERRDVKYGQKVLSIISNPPCYKIDEQFIFKGCPCTKPDGR